MKILKTLLKSKWTYFVLVAIAGAIGGDTFAEPVKKLLPMLLGQ